ncbi:MAG: cation:proton antiporter, partial [Candidatus Woesearchaeota archaeon]
MDIITNLFVVSSVIIVGLISQYIFRKLHIPDVLVLISFGAVLSYLGLTEDLNRESQGLIFLITFSLVYVIFYGALPIRLKALFSTFKYATILSLLNFVAITFLLAIVSRLLGFGWVMALSLAALFCVLDGAIINSILEIVRLGQRAVAQVQTESAVVDTLVIVFILSILNFAGMGFADVL